MDTNYNAMPLSSGGKFLEAQSKEEEEERKKERK
jgi:hypothetical protein